MIHLYCGESKGKTTAAMGLALRAAGHGERVVIAQFLKSGNSGERKIFDALPNVTLMPVPDTMKFTFRMTEEEKKQEGERQTQLLTDTLKEGEGAQLVVLDELCAALNAGMVSLTPVLTFLEAHKETEVVITGRNPPQALVDQADYITEMVKRRHPFDQGLPARKGVE